MPFAQHIGTRATMDVRRMKNKPDFTAEWTMVITWFGVKPVPSFQARDQVSFIFIQNFSLNYKSLRENTIVAVLYNLSEGHVVTL